MPELWLGIDLGGTNVKVALVSHDGEVVQKSSLKTHADRGPDAVMAIMAEGAASVVADAGQTMKDIAAAGIGAPGPMNWQTGVVYSPPNLPGWKDVPLAQLMGERLGIRCYVDNDANCACLGEFERGAGRDVRNMCLFTLGTGIGGGLVIEGQLLRGIDGTAGEIGHMRVEHEGRACNCGAKGCLEAYASATGLVKTAKERLTGGAVTRLRDLTLESITARKISELALAGDTFCVEVIQETGRWLGVAAADLINLLNPEMLAFAGGLADAGDMLLGPAREIAAAMAFEVPARRAKIVRAELGKDAGVIGAAFSARQRHKGGS